MVTAHKLLTDMSKDGVKPAATHYATLIRSYGCLHRDVKSAVSVYEEMKKSGVKADESVSQAMLNTYIDNDDMKSAETFYEEMVKKVKSSAYIENLFIEGYGKQGQVEKAQDVYNRMNVKKEPSTFEAMVKVLVANGRPEEARAVIQEMQSHDFPPKIMDGVSQLVV
jgi:pentatricopeptide repeat protein